MEIGLISFSYENTPIEIREEINFSSRDYEKAYQILNNNPDLKESIIVSTCNRTEVYFIAEDEFNSVIDFVKDMLVKVFTLNSDDILDSYLQYKNDIEVVEHLLEVASACRSQVVGEQQILGQIKSEYERALKYEASGKFLNYFFKEAISTSKKIRTETGFCDKNLSLSSVAVSFIEKKVDKFKDKDILVVGIGEMSRLVIDILQKKGVNNIYATNRTHHKVVKVSDYYDNVIPVNYSGLPKKIFEVDIVISSTSAPHFVIHYDKLQKYYGEEKINEADKPLI
ncbi:MAG: glutamyl-tRNA reductase, partial [Bacillota bacterium]